MRVELKTIPAPPIAFPDLGEAVPAPSAEEYEWRLADLYTAAAADWVVVYADREHYANLVYLVNFDPRFEETLLLLGPGGRRVLILGNEGFGYTSVLPLSLELALCQSLSLPAQPRQTAPRLKEVLARLGVSAGQRVCMVGWKYLEAEETDDVTTPAFIPAFFVDAIRSLVGPSGVVVDGSALMIHPQHGLRAVNSAAQLAAFEWAARHCSAAIFNVVRGARPGMSEMQAMNLMNFSGLPMTMHPIFSSSDADLNGLRSAGARRVQYGDAVTTGIGYWGSLVCRAGMMLGQPDAGFFENLVVPYFSAIAAWYQSMRLGASGGEIFEAVRQAFGGGEYGSTLNPGHLTSYDEWVHSPIRPQSSDKIVSGMAFQVDIIPGPMPAGRALNCEDTVAIADTALRAELHAAYPQVWERIQHRREFMRQALGLQLAEEVLPLSDGAAYLPPFWLAPELVCVVKE